MHPYPLRVALVGDFHPQVMAHRAIPRALLLAAEAAGVGVSPVWMPTDTITDASSQLNAFDGLWCTPGSPYRHLGGVLAAIGHARRRGLPFLGTCGGFQHAVLEHARAVLGWTDAEHAETAPDAPHPVIAPLACGLVNAERALRLAPGSRLAAAYGREHAREAYQCRYGVAPAMTEALFTSGLRAVAWAEPQADTERQQVLPAVHAVERTDHPFFVATLFQAERAALRGEPVGLVTAFLKAMRPSSADRSPT